MNNFGIYENKNSQSYSGGLSSSVTIFSGFQIKNAIAAQGFTLQASLEDLKKARENLSVNIASAYLQILFNKELYKIALEQVALSQTQLTRYENMAELGKIPAGQVYEAKAQLAKDKFNAADNLSKLQLALLDLSQLLDLKEWNNFDIAEPDIEGITPILLTNSADDIFKEAVVSKASVKASEFRLKSSEKNLEVSKGAVYPKLSLGANYSNGFFPNTKNPLDNSNISFSDQMNNNARTSIGFTLSVPIFNRFDTRNNIKLSKIELENARLEVENSKKNLYKEIQQAWFNAKTASEKYLASTESVQNMEEAFRFSEEKFNNGRATIYEFNEAKMNLASAKSNKIQAKYNYLLSTKILDFYRGEALKL